MNYKCCTHLILLKAYCCILLNFSAFSIVECDKNKLQSIYLIQHNVAETIKK